MQGFFLLLLLLLLLSPHSSSFSQNPKFPTRYFYCHHRQPTFYYDDDEWFCLQQDGSRRSKSSIISLWNHQRRMDMRQIDAVEQEEETRNSKHSDTTASASDVFTTPTDVSANNTTLQEYESKDTATTTLGGYYGSTTRRTSFQQVMVSAAFASSMIARVATNPTSVHAASIPAATAAPAKTITPPADDEDNNGYVPAKRPTAYRVDSTQPPTLIPLDNAQKQTAILKDLSKGYGTSKSEILDENDINLNNLLNKAVFGTIDAITSIVKNKGSQDMSKSGLGYASFVCLGIPSPPTTSTVDIDLANSLVTSLLSYRKKNKETAIGLACLPISTQPALDEYLRNGDEIALKNAILDSGVDIATLNLYLPLLQNTVQQQQRFSALSLLALSPEFQDMESARNNGLQSVNVERRRQYVIDPSGFIALTQTPQYKLYTDRSLLKDCPRPSEGIDQTNTKGCFAERILVHETAATMVAQYAVTRPDSLVVLIAPIPDVRFLMGMNGRIPRIYSAALEQQQQSSSNNINNRPPMTRSKVTDDAVTTVLLNPTANETLSASRYLRLEIGTGPETLAYQTKVSDYLWFSKSPKVNAIPRLRNA